MCTLVIMHRPRHGWPLLVAANRDEMADRPWLPPARHWPDRPHVVAGLDQQAGGSWLGINDDGLVAAIMNREGSLGSETTKRSRGELVLEALDHAEAEAAAQALSDLDPQAYRSFNLVVADRRAAFWIKHTAEPTSPIEVTRLPEGLSMFSARDRNDLSAARIRDYLPRFQRAPLPDPGRDDWMAWELLLASRAFSPDVGPTGAMTVVSDTGFGTLSASLMALPAVDASGVRPIWRFAAGRPDQQPFELVAL